MQTFREWASPGTLLQSDQEELKSFYLDGLVYCGGASIGPGGIEIRSENAEGESSRQLQSDQEELKLSYNAYLTNLTKASIGPGGIEMVVPGTLPDWAAALQSDQEELKSGVCVYLVAKVYGFNRTRRN